MDKFEFYGTPELDPIIRELEQKVSALIEKVQAQERTISQLSLALSELQKNVQTRWATERQKAFINDICETLHIPPPEGFPNRLTFTAASKFIDEKAKFFYDAKHANGNGGGAKQ